MSALKIASPVVPDFYQGSELWDLNLAARGASRPGQPAARGLRGTAAALDRIDALLAQPASDRAAGIASMLKDWNDRAVKLLVTAAGLRLSCGGPGAVPRG